MIQITFSHDVVHEARPFVAIARELGQLLLLEAHVLEPVPDLRLAHVGRAAGQLLRGELHGCGLPRAAAADSSGAAVGAVALEIASATAFVRVGGGGAFFGRTADGAVAELT